ncbi:hypothetical protein CLV92_10911 [Kineococcus xinjiangensis]|uniref:Uncharacterized protein n=1 Tax=Kineococcus xinjiangensis TaxID=512762 RepID=A0A2S6IHR9_9ACTN|nr:hypothetical protein CLV92_10911 [Kineococcus xinjiangensis]
MTVLVAAVVCGVLALVAGVVFARSAVVVPGTAAAGSGAVLVALVPPALPGVVLAAGILAALVGLAPAWVRREEALAAVRSVAAPADVGRWLGRWRVDRAFAAFLVLAFPAVATAAAVAFHTWATSR